MRNVLALVWLCALLAGPNPAPPDALARLGSALLSGSHAYDYNRQLADGIGPRLTGSANYRQAVDWAVQQFTALGLSRVGREAWVLPSTWEPVGVVNARMLAPREQPLHLVSEGWSPSTPPGGVRGRVYYLSDVRPAAVAAQAAQIRGTVVLIDEAAIGPAYAAGEGTLADGLRAIGTSGARGLLFGVGTVNNVNNMFGDTGFVGELANLPAGNLGLEDTLLLQRLLRQGSVQVEFSFQNRVRPQVPVDNVVAEIPGRESAAGFVIVGAHLDSWQLGTGAQDNGSGVASVLAMAQALRAAGMQPRRTIRFVLFGGEEEGLLGSVQYARRHAAEMSRCAGVFITDNGAIPPEGWYTFGRGDDKQALAALAPALQPFHAAASSDEGRFTFATDEAPFLVQGVPSFVLWAPMGAYLHIHHQPGDTFDKINPRDLNLSAAVVGVTAYGFADMAARTPRLAPAAVNEQLARIGMAAAYRDMLAHHLF